MNQHAKYPVYAYQAFHEIVETTESIRQHCNKHPTIVIRYRANGFHNEDPFIEATFRPLIKDTTYYDELKVTVRSFFHSLDRFVSIFQIKITYDAGDEETRLQEIIFNTDFPN